MLRRLRSFLVRQRLVPWVGEAKETLAQAAFWFTPINFVMLGATFYFTTLRYVAPWFTFPMFMTVAIVGVCVIMVMEFKFITPSIWAFRGKQMDLRNQKPGREVTVAVSGGFDPLNGRGHATHIRDARRLGNRLVIILSRDDQLEAKGNKADGTFYPGIRDRFAIMELVADEVVINIDRDGTCAETLRMVRPQVFAKGGDRGPDNMPENELAVCREIGCQIVYGIGDPKETSSSDLIRRRDAERDRIASGL